MNPQDWPRQAISGAIVLYFGWAIFAHWSEGLEQTITNLVMMVVGYWLGSSKNSTDNAKRAGDAVDLARGLSDNAAPVAPLPVTVDRRQPAERSGADRRNAGQAMTDVPLRDYTDARIADLRLVGVVVALSILTVIFTMNAGNAKATKLALDGSEKATSVALAASDAKGVAHNGLIDRMREMSATFITRGNVVSFLTAIAACAAIYLAFVRN
jgi:hypothetical protein